MNVLDIGIILILIMSFIVGFKTGVMRELVSFIGIIVVFIISFELKGVIGNILCKYLPFFKFSGGIAGLPIINILIYQTIAFLLIFSLLLGIYAVALNFSKFLQKIINMTIVLWLPSKILGGIVSAIKTWSIIFVILLVISVPLSSIEIFHDSIMVKTILNKTPILNIIAGPFTNATEDIYELSKEIKNKDNPDKINKEAIDIMLKYNIVDKRTIMMLIVKNKIDNVNNLDEVLNKYD